MVTEEQRALFRQFAFEVAEVVIERHMKTCPIVVKLQRGVWFAIGLAAGSGGISLAALVKLIGG